MNPVVPSKPSRTFSIFQNSAEELEERLAAVPTERAIRLAEVARGLGTRFRGWSETPPDDESRVQAIQELLDFTREAYEYLAEYKRKSSHPP